MQFANRVMDIGTETAFEVLARAKDLERQGKSIVHLEIGEPDFDTPENIVNTAVHALKNGQTHYTPSFGILELREAIAQDFYNRQGVKVDPSEVVVTPGAKPILFFAIMALINPGDEVIYPNPGFPIYESLIRFAGGVPVPLQLHGNMEFKVNVDELKRKLTSKTKMVILNYPQNPTGGVLDAADLKAIVDVLADHDVTVLSDEIYSQIIYGDFKHTSIATFPGMKERTIVLDGFSKAYAMTGWRMGYGIMNAKLAERMTKLIVNTVSCTATFTQLAGVEAIKGSQVPVQNMVKEFEKRRDVIVEGLNQIKGFKCHLPKGAFYVFPNIEATGIKSQDLANRILYEAGVAVLSGTAFGEFGEGYIRLSYANSIENIREGLKRIKQLLG